MGLSKGVAAKAAGICCAKAAADAAARNVLRSIICLGSIVGFQPAIAQPMVLNSQTDSAKSRHRNSSTVKRFAFCGSGQSSLHPASEMSWDGKKRRWHYENQTQE
jgi:hypothetical protein